MYGKKKAGKGAIRTIIDADTRINGDIRFVGDALIDGYVKGNVTAAGGEETATLSISEHGCVEGSVVAPHLLLNGRVQGQVVATERVKLGPKARVIGDVQYKRLEMAIGAEVNGRLIHDHEPRVGHKHTGAAAHIKPVPSNPPSHR